MYTIKNRARQFLALELPVDARLISIFVGDRPSRLVETTRNGKQIHLAALPKTSEADLAFPVKLVLTGRLTTGSLPKGFRPRAAEIDLPAPRVISQTDDPDFGIPVAKTLWTVYLPEDLNADLIKDPGRSNLSDAGGDRRGVAYALDQTRSALELASVVENSPSSRVRYQAMRNLKNLQQSIDGYLAESAKDYGSSYGYLSESGDAKGLSLRGQLDSEEGRQLLELRESLNKKLAENRGKMKIDEAKKEIVILSDGSRPQRVEEEQLQQQIEFNNDALITSNSVAGINLGEVRTQTVPRLATDSEQQLGENFNYRLLEAAPNQKLGRAFTGKDVANPSSAENRLKRRQQNLDNIQQLERSYATMNQSKQQSPQDQAARQRGGRGAATHFDRFYSEAELPKGRQAGENLNLGIPQPDQDSDDAMNGYGFALVPQSRFESDDTNGNGVLDLQGGTNMVWSQAGGLSLQIGIPQDGQKLSFSKISGAPKLALAIRPRETLKIGFGLIWTIVWLAVGIVVIVVAARSPSHDSVARAIPVLLVAIGLIAFFTLPMVFSICGFMAFVLGAAIFGFQHCQHPQAK